MKEIGMTWTEFKDIATSKNLEIQYVDFDGRYEIYAEDGLFLYACNLKQDGGTDVTDFENNYKSGCNKPTHPLATDKTPYVRVTEKTVGKMMQLYGVEFEAAGSDTTNYDIKWNEDIEFVGLKGTAKNTHDGDKVDSIIIDKDNILGYGSDFVVTEFGKDVPAKILEIHGCDAETTTAATIMAGLYLRISYENTHETEASRLYIALRYYH